MSVPFDVKSRIVSTSFCGTTCDSRVASAFVASPRLPVSTTSRAIEVSFLTASMHSLERPTKVRRVVPTKCANLTQQVPMLPMGAVILTVGAGCSSATFNAQTAFGQRVHFCTNVETYIVQEDVNQPT